MDWLNNIKEGLKSGYNSFDSTIGGVLPGGAQLDLGNLGGEVIRDIQKAVVPGWGGRTIDKVVSRTAAAQDDLAAGNVPGAAGDVGGNVAGSKGRAFIIDEIMEKIGKKITQTGAKRLGSRFVNGVIPGGQGVALADTGKDLLDIYSTVLQTTTGKTLGEHKAIYDAVRKIGRASCRERV